MLDKIKKETAKAKVIEVLKRDSHLWNKETDGSRSFKLEEFGIRYGIHHPDFNKEELHLGLQTLEDEDLLKPLERKSINGEVTFHLWCYHPDKL